MKFWIFILLIFISNLFALSAEEFQGTKWVQEKTYYEGTNFHYYVVFERDSTFYTYNFEIGYSTEGKYYVLDDSLHLDTFTDCYADEPELIQKTYSMIEGKLYLINMREFEDNLWKTKEFNNSLGTLIKDEAYKPDQPFPEIFGTKWISADSEKPDYYEFFPDSVFIFYDSDLNKSFAGNFYIDEKFTLRLSEETIIDDPTFNWDVHKTFISFNNILFPLNHISNITPKYHNTKFDPKYYFMKDNSYVIRDTPDINELLKQNYDSVLDTPGLIKYEEVTDSTGKVIQKSYSFQFQRNNESTNVVSRSVSDFDIDLELLEIEDNSKFITSDFSSYSKPILENFVRPAYEKDKELTGYSSASFYILPDNSICDIEIVSTTNKDLNEYVLKIVNENTYKAAKDQQGNSVKSWVLLTIFFSGL